MIIACPACNTRYVVPDSAIGLDGRTVRCAKCKHSWFQDGPELVLQQVVAEPEPSISAHPVIPPEPAPVTAGYGSADADYAEPSFAEPAAAPLPPVADVAEDYSQFDHSPPFRPHRNMARIWTWSAALFAVVALGAILAVNAFGLPQWVPVAKPLFGAAQPDLELSFPVDEQERRTLANGTEYFGARIIVHNKARESRAVPPIVIVLRDQRETQVYSWEVVPPKPTLAPGERMTIKEARTDVPKSAVFADIGWAPR